MHVITLFFHGEHDGNIFFPIQSHQSGLERRERHPGGVQQVKFDVIFYYVKYILQPYFFMANTMEIFFSPIWGQQGCLERRERPPGEVQQEKT